MTTPPHPFVQKLSENLHLSAHDVSTLIDLDVQTPGQTLSALITYPSLQFDSSRQALIGELRHLAGLAPQTRGGIRTRGGTTPDEPPDGSFLAGYTPRDLDEKQPTRPYYGGALPPDEEAAPLAGGPQGGPPAPPANPGVPAGPDVLLPLPEGWAGEVRDQGPRPTCVAFALVACLEMRYRGRFVSWWDLTGYLDRSRSEQFLFWGAKHCDHRPMQAGTTLRAAYEALQKYGVCRERHWFYNPADLPANQGHGDAHVPSAAAQRCARARRGAHALDILRTTADFGPPGDGTRARAVYEALLLGRPVAVTLAVFRDPEDHEKTGWTNAYATQYGVILNPPNPATGASLRADLGHAVCIVGFRRDPNERYGGYFLFRNSWGTGWGIRPNTNPHYVPRRGYGQISAYYVDHFLWELCCL